MDDSMRGQIAYTLPTVAVGCQTQSGSDGWKPGWQTHLISLLFIGSGCAALIYEIVWFQLLSLVIGASAFSLSILLASFMGGMCLGSLVWPRLVSSTRHPLHMYAALEAGIALCGVLILLILPSIGQMYWPLAGHGTGSLVVRGILAGGILLVPTMLMGATLPAVARWVRTTRFGLAQLGLFYGMNTLGAVAGTLFAGFVLLPAYDIHVATLAAISLNLIVAAIAIWLARQTAYTPAPVSAPVQLPTANRLAYVVAACSGMTALGSEIIWTRQLSLLFGATVYTFSILLAVFLTGLGLGGAAGSALSRRIRSPLIGLGWCQFLLVLAIPFGAWMIVSVIPFWWAERLASATSMRMLQDLIRATAAMLPATLLWGASFPLAVAAAGRDDADSGTLVGGVYAANTLGAITGSLLFGLVILPGCGTYIGQQLLTNLCGLSGILLFAVVQFQSAGAKSNLLSQFGLVGAGAAVLALSSFLPQADVGMLAFGRNVQSWNAPQAYLEVREGLDATVAVTQRNEQYIDFHVSGKVVASNSPLDLRIERMLGHLPALAHARPQNALVIGCGAGVTAGSLLQHHSIDRIVICEIEANVPPAAARWFARENYRVMENPRTNIVHDDGRHFVATTTEKFDVITSDPIHPWVRGAAALYTADFFRQCKAHLNEDGVLALWVPLYETNEAAVKCELATFLEVFPNGTVWSSALNGSGGYDVVLLGTADGRRLTLDSFTTQLAFRPAVADSLKEVQLGTSAGMLHVFGGYAANLTDWLADAQINRDYNLRLQYLAGSSHDHQASDDIYTTMLWHMRTRNHLQSAPLAQ